MNNPLLACLAEFLAVVAVALLVPAYRNLRKLNHYSPVGIPAGTAVRQMAALRWRAILYGAYAANAGGAASLALYGQKTNQTTSTWLIILILIAGFIALGAGWFAVNRAVQTQIPKVIDESRRLEDAGGHRD
ncbi:hypothetical protein [Rhodococcus tukisamuensis]|uniref:Uncharacterized protein n=1 Tax=Rhodococcus tukisamuensis TaxID=168276 RepID=A0A1G6TBT4_9NOCA|nr:hypothetical protein [Rhodococcus tukisamuensis]SDD26006.1 hypothetical protein SAMN05444580_103453 [Rhodococcus tukisamuensis]